VQKDSNYVIYNWWAPVTL